MVDTVYLNKINEDSELFPEGMPLIINKKMHVRSADQLMNVGAHFI